MNALSYKPKVYTASKIWHAPFWRKRVIDSQWSHVEFTARWPYMEHLEEGKTPPEAEFAHFWTIDMQDVKRSDFLLLLGSDAAVHSNSDNDLDSLKGGLVEAGMAIAYGLTVLVIGFQYAPSSHSWTHHPRVVRLDCLEDARLFLKGYKLS